MSKIRVLLADNNSVVREELTLLLNLEEDIEVVGAAQDGIEAKKLAEELLPDILLMDVKMPLMDGIEATRQLKKDHPELGIILFSIYDVPDFISNARKAGASTYVIKDVPLNKLVDVIRRVFRKEALPARIA